jgi:hypothetical protein
LRELAIDPVENPDLIGIAPTFASLRLIKFLVLPEIWTFDT